MRELHVYGTAIPVHGRDPTKFQHQGFGTLLMEEAERIAKEEHGSIKLAVISGTFSTRHSCSEGCVYMILISLYYIVRGWHSRLLPPTWIRARRAIHEQVAIVRHEAPLYPPLVLPLVLSYILVPCSLESVFSWKFLVAELRTGHSRTYSLASMTVIRSLSRTHEEIYVRMLAIGYKIEPVSV